MKKKIKKSNECVGLMNKKELDITKYITNMINQKPKVRFTVNCYHHYTTTHRDANGRMHTTTHRRVTYTESRDFQYSTVKYVGQKFQKKFQEKVYLDLALYKEYECGDEKTKEIMNYERKKIQEDNVNRDRFMDFREDLIVDGFKNTIYSKSFGSNEPNCFSLNYYIIYSFFLLSYCYRRYVNKFLDKQEYTLRYKIFFDQINEKENENFVYQNYSNFDENTKLFS
jgi:hypothetical protein